MTTDERFHQILDYYDHERIENQVEWYRTKAEKIAQRDRALRLTSGVLMVSVSLFTTLAFITGSINVPSLKITWAVLLTVIPPLATALLTLRNILQYEQMRIMYRQTNLRLRKVANAHMPHTDDPDFARQVKQLVSQIEGTIAAQNQQWMAQKSKVEAATLPQAVRSSSVPDVG